MEKNLKNSKGITLQARAVQLLVVAAALRPIRTTLSVSVLHFINVDLSTDSDKLQQVQTKLEFFE